MRIGVTGGAGYIGVHVVVDLLQAGHHVVVLDDFSTGHPEALIRAQTLAGRPCAIVPGDIADRARVRDAFAGVDLVIHLAAAKLVDESMAHPARYFRNNVGGMASLLEVLDELGVRRFVYSSSAAVYGTQAVMPIREDAPVQPESPYGLTKVHGEQMLDWMVARRGWHAVSLRYFNPVGAHESGQIGQPPEAAVALVPRVLAALATPGARVKIFGTDWPTADGTCLRDYVHISDLSRAHLLAMECLERPGHQVFNVGTGRPHSVREVIAACDEAAGWRVPVDAAPRREGDMAVAVADPARFNAATGFVATRQLHEMVESAWRWAQANPDGYGPKRAHG